MSLLQLTVLIGGLGAASTWPHLWQLVRTRLSPHAQHLTGEVIGRLFGYHIGLITMLVMTGAICLSEWRRQRRPPSADLPNALS